VSGRVGCVVWAWLGVPGTGPKGDGPPGAQFLCEHTLAAIRGPLWGPVHDVVYFGPVFLVALLHWRRVAAWAARLGPGAVFALGLLVAFAAGSQSRQWNHLVPLLVIATLVVTNERWTAPRAVGFALLTLAWSKVWLTIGYDRPLKFHEFPNQRYFMNLGPYASDTMYIVHLGAALITAVALVLLLRAAGTSTRTSGSATAGTEDYHRPAASASPG